MFAARRWGAGAKQCHLPPRLEMAFILDASEWCQNEEADGRTYLSAQCDAVRLIAADADPTRVMIQLADPSCPSKNCATMGASQTVLVNSQSWAEPLSKSLDADAEAVVEGGARLPSTHVAMRRCAMGLGMTRQPPSSGVAGHTVCFRADAHRNQRLRETPPCPPRPDQQQTKGSADFEPVRQAAVVFLCSPIGVECAEHMLEAAKALRARRVDVHVVQFGHKLEESMAQALAEMARCDPDDEDCLYPIACDNCGAAVFCNPPTPPPKSQTTSPTQPPPPDTLQQEVLGVRLADADTSPAPQVELSPLPRCLSDTAALSKGSVFENDGITEVMDEALTEAAAHTLHDEIEPGVNSLAGTVAEPIASFQSIEIQGTGDLQPGSCASERPAPQCATQTKMSPESTHLLWQLVEHSVVRPDLEQLRQAWQACYVPHRPQFPLCAPHPPDTHTHSHPTSREANSATGFSFWDEPQSGGGDSDSDEVDAAAEQYGFWAAQVLLAPAGKEDAQQDDVFGSLARSSSSLPPTHSSIHHQLSVEKRAEFLKDTMKRLALEKVTHDAAKLNPAQLACRPHVLEMSMSPATLNMRRNLVMVVRGRGGEEQLDVRIDPADVQKVAQVLGNPLVSIRVGKLLVSHGKNPGRLQGPCTLSPDDKTNKVGGCITLRIYPGSEMRLKWEAPKSQYHPREEMLAFISPSTKASGGASGASTGYCPEIQLMDEDPSGRAFFVVAGKGAGARRRYFWLQEVSRADGLAKIDKLRTLLHQPPSLSQLTKLSDRCLNQMLVAAPAILSLLDSTQNSKLHALHTLPAALQLEQTRGEAQRGGNRARAEDWRRLAGTDGAQRASTSKHAGMEQAGDSTHSAGTRSTSSAAFEQIEQQDGHQKHALESAQAIQGTTRAMSGGNSEESQRPEDECFCWNLEHIGGEEGVCMEPTSERLRPSTGRAAAMDSWSIAGLGIPSSRQIGCAHVLDYMVSTTNSCDGTSNKSCDSAMAAEEMKRPVVSYKSLALSSRRIKSTNCSKRVPMNNQIALNSQDTEGCALISSSRSLGSCSEDNINVVNAEHPNRSNASPAQQGDTGTQASETSQAVDLLNLAQLLRKFQ